MTGYQEILHLQPITLPEIKFHLWSLYWIPRLLRARTIVELGIRSGDSTRCFLAACKDQPPMRLISYDIAGDAYRVQEVTEKMGVPWEGRAWECRTGDSIAAGAAWNEGPIDVLFVDTEHSYEQVHGELEAWWTNIRFGGAILLHDTGLTDERGRDGVWPAMKWHVEHYPGWTIENHLREPRDGDTGLGLLFRRNEP